MKESIPEDTPSTEGSSGSASEENDYDSELTVKAVREIIQDYKDGKVDTETGPKGASGPTFTPLPEGWVLPDIQTIRDIYSVELMDENLLVIKIRLGENMTMLVRIKPDNNYHVSAVSFTEENL